MAKTHRKNKPREEERYDMNRGAPIQKNAPPRDSGPEIPMGKCIDCDQDWSMFQSEKDWWEKLKADRGYQIPKRCPNCRKTRKEQKEKERQHPSGSEKEIRAQIAERIRQIAERFISESLDDQQLYNELYALSDEVEGREST